MVPPATGAVGTPVAPVPAATSPHEGIERFLGIKVAAWVGGIIVIAAIAAFARFVIDQGWFGLMPPTAKLALAYGLSGAFVLAGSALRERVGRFPAGALMAAGIGGLYVATCVGVSPLNLFGPTAALVAGAAVALAGGAVTFRSREFTVGGISLAGAYVVPAFAGMRLADGGPAADATLVTGGYLTAVYGVALVLARSGPASFGWFRTAGIAQAGYGAVLALSSWMQPSVTVAIFAMLWWAMAVGECSFAALQGRSSRGNVLWTVGATLVTAPIAVFSLRAPAPWTTVHAWIPLVMAAACAGMSVPLRGAVPPGRSDDVGHEADPAAQALVDAARRQSTMLFLLCGALLLAQVGTIVRGGALSATWAVVGALAVLAGRRGGDARVAGLGLASLALAVLATAFLTGIDALAGGGGTLLWQHPEPGSGETSLWAVRVSTGLWSPVAVSFALLFGARWWSMGRDPQGRPAMGSVFLAGCAAIMWTLMAFAACDRYAAITTLVAVPVAAVLVGRTHVLVKVVGLTWSAMAAWGWFLVTMVESSGLGTSRQRPTGGIVVAALVVAALALLARKFRGERFAQVPVASAFAFGLAAVATLLVIEVNLRGADAGPERLGTLLASVAVGVLATVGTIAARRAGQDTTESVGTVGTGIAVCAALFAVVAGTAAPVPGTGWAEHWILNASTPCALVLAGCAWALHAFARPRGGAAPLGTLFGLAAVAWASCVVFRFFEPEAMPPFETSRTIQQSALSVWLSVAAVLLVVQGFRSASGRLRWTGLGLLGTVALKVLVLDMAAAAVLWRVLALLATGLLLVVTSVVYSRAGSGQRAPGKTQGPAGTDRTVP